MSLASERLALSYFVSVGWSPAQAAGIVANLVAESGLNPAATGDGGQAYGIAQWHPDRQAKFEVMGEPIRGSSLESQLAFVHWELQNTEKPAGDQLRACTTASEAGACVSKRYERPADREGEAMRRGVAAEAILQRYTPPDPTAPQPETPVIPLLIPIIAQLLPGLISAFGNNSERATKNAATAQVIADAVTKVTETAGIGQAVDKLSTMSADERKAVEAQVLAEQNVQIAIESYEAGGGGIAGARRAAADPATPPFYKTGPFWVSVLILLIPWSLVADVLFVHPAMWRPEDRSQIILLAVSITSGVMGYFLGSSVGSARKDSVIASQ